MERTESCCNSQCSQGRACPARQACELPEDAAMRATLVDLLWAAGLAGCVIVAVVALVSLYR